MWITLIFITIAEIVVAAVAAAVAAVGVIAFLTPTQQGIFNVSPINMQLNLTKTKQALDIYTGKGQYVCFK